MAQPVRSVDRRFTTTAFEFPGYFIAQAHGVVRGITVRNPNAGKAIVGAFASLAGGESSTYIEMAEKARERAFLRMLEHAAAAGGNAVIGVEFTGQEIIQKRNTITGQDQKMTEVMAYGTAVTLVPLQQQVPQQPVMHHQQQQPIMQQPPQQAVYSPISSPYGQPQHQQFSPALPPKN
ncbi:hypothetical protein BG015_009109 [Linnemannia schmuckeri]|uniref:Uncharacterized protein n=1 Tax=Linnemannia schmuckeri TaxID=64567 RepID=A0A9P5VA05_9FUNG|nr:hypothetical protein BG015_009109 [Linnemannia schmuckeri]